ncbi:putative ABC-type transport systems, permease component [Vibrio nigripulchritudo MADA3029]|uniref:carbohydrate ABC transporter permease n=1 Tax=Vibrio TaxID=662 RepID=UPI0003B1CFB8|nr:MULTISPECIES: sugar ABC transporter permease [Vibrio]KJY75883.1 ABC transporter permease [Vibrio nigripulchritudo]UAB71734.1 sugar ABC transporter permease [Vibrio sp. SCSIO 43132]CCN45974.1 putative ABC-type transport systems, permease component [Vibrio nigripulchritudo MADA3020]CCN54097.1 putative ABC-type transport systems, permease component [Vibrio nigripulchritudo MADA3021]CCN61168.1 putative ABC-type transport systems, permease component [Vibrio nigripulchritudo MADA3029]
MKAMLSKGMVGSSPPVPLRSARAHRRNFILAMLLPATAVLLLTTLFPFLLSLYLSFTDYSLLNAGEKSFIGFGNYSKLFQSEEFWSATKVTLVFTIVAVTLQTILGVGMAALLHYESKQAPWLRLLFLLPIAITPVAATFTFRLMFNPSLGVLNYMLTSIGLEPSAWTAAPESALFSLILVDTWQWTPFILLITAGGLASLPSEPEEASEVDGANGWQTFFYVTLPQLKPYIALALLFRVIDAFKTFDIIFVLTGGGPGITTRTLNILAYKQGIEFLEMGYASSIAIVMLIFTLIVSQVFLRKLGLFDLKTGGTS